MEKSDFTFSTRKNQGFLYLKNGDCTPIFSPNARGLELFGEILKLVPKGEF